MIYIATCYSHFGAVKFKKICEGAGMKARMMPVPRDLSSSCGTCVLFKTAELDEGKLQPLLTPELEQLVLDENGYKLLYEAEE